MLSTTVCVTLLCSCIVRLCLAALADSHGLGSRHWQWLNHPGAFPLAAASGPCRGALAQSHGGLGATGGHHAPGDTIAARCCLAQVEGLPCPAGGGLGHCHGLARAGGLRQARSRGAPGQRCLLSRALELGVSGRGLLAPHSQVLHLETQTPNVTHLLYTRYLPGG